MIRFACCYGAGRLAGAIVAAGIRRRHRRRFARLVAREYAAANEQWREQIAALHVATGR